MGLIHGSCVDEVLHPIYTDSDGRLVVVMKGADDPVRKYVALGTTNETTVWDPTSGKKFVITDLVASAGNNCTITFRDGTGGSTFMLFDVLKSTTVPINFQTPIISVAADNNLTAQTTAITSYITISGYEI